MCGIAGIVRREPAKYNGSMCMDQNDCLYTVSKALRHRGPDDSGYLLLYGEEKKGNRTPRFIEAADDDTLPEIKSRIVDVREAPQNWDLALISRRLAILDPTPQGHQPLSNEDKTVWVVFNGEIYNFHELRNELRKQGHEFVCDCDTEVIVHGYEAWSIEGLLKRARGMWSFALLDLTHDMLYVARDYFGIKPLYYSNYNENLIFASEIKVFNIFMKLEPNTNAVLRHLLYVSLDRGETFYKNIKRLPPSHYMSIDLSRGGYKIKSYWNPPRRVSKTIGYDEAVATWCEAFLESVKIHLRSDYPIGFLLSGGLDSSSLVAAWSYLRKHNLLERWAAKGEPIAVTFSHGGSRDEVKYVKKLARDFGLKLFVVSPSIEDIWSELEKIVYHHDEPPAGSSVIAEWFVMKEASKHVKVVLSGQGGDELLAGYQRYVYKYIMHLLKRKKLLKALVLAWKFRDLLLEKKSHFVLLRKIKSIRKRLQLSNIVGGIKELSHEDFVNNMLMNDLIGEGLQRLLHNADRDSMAFSIEARVPFLDAKLAEISLSLPGEYKLGNGWTKRIHRDALRGILPDYILFRRSKIGFEAPSYAWIKELTLRRLVDWNNVINVLKENGVPNDILKFIKTLVKKIDKKLSDAEADYLWRVLFTYIWLKQVNSKGAADESAPHMEYSWGC